MFWKNSPLPLFHSLRQLNTRKIKCIERTIMTTKLANGLQLSFDSPALADGDGAHPYD
jgi:hypothetical protein